LFATTCGCHPGSAAALPASIIRCEPTERIAETKVAGVYKSRKPSVPMDDVHFLKAEKLPSGRIGCRLNISGGDVLHGA